MYPKSNLICLHLRGNPEGARCDVFDTAIRDIVDVDIRLCLGRRHEACSIYHMSLKKIVPTSAGIDDKNIP